MAAVAAAFGRGWLGSSTTGGGGGGGSAARRLAADGTRIFTAAELEGFDGRAGRPIYLSYAGRIYDVTAGRQYYDKDTGGYGFFAGRDATRGYVTGDFKGDLTSRIDDLSGSQLLDLQHWSDFYENEDKYPFQGILEGYFYDGSGEPTAAHRDMLRKLADAKDGKAAEQEEKKKHPVCNSRWAQGEGGHVWCDDENVPRQLYSALTKSTRCACLSKADAAVMTGEGGAASLYDGCDPGASKCKTTD